MSAPLVVNTKDGVCWTRRTVTSGGIALYAPEGVCKCPVFVMATLAELAEHGIVGSADVLPMPVGPVPQVSPADADRAKAPWGRDEDGRPLLPSGAHWTDVPELVDRTLAGIQARVDGAQSGHWYDASLTETWRPAGTVRTNVDGYQRGVGRFIARPGDMELVLHAHDDLSWCLEMIAKFRARVAELEAERHVTNEALSDAAVALRANRDRIAELEALTPAAIQTCRVCGAGYSLGQPCATCEFQARMAAETASSERPVDGLTAAFSPVASLREDPHDSPLHHPYLLSHDLPETDGAK